MTIKDLILELANYHWRGNKKFPSGYMAEVMVVDPIKDSNNRLPMGFRTVIEAGWVSEHEYNEGASSSPIIMPGELPGGWKNSCQNHPHRRLVGLHKLQDMIRQEIHKCRQECREEDIRLGRDKTGKGD
jgi:hypothetical protein